MIRIYTYMMSVSIYSSEYCGNMQMKNSIKHLKPWGTTAYVHIPKPKSVQARKAAPRAWKGKLVG